MHKQLTYFILSFIFILSITAIISSCGSDTVTNNNTNPPEPVDTSDFQYPFTNGSNWSYSYTLSAENIRPDSIRHYFSSYPVTGYGYSEILYDTNDPLGGMVKVIFDKQITGNDTTASRYYYTNSENSMVCYGYRGGSTPSFPFRKQSQIIFSAEDRLFGSFSKMSSFISYGYDFSSPEDTFIRFSQVVVALKYPVLKNTKWTIFDFGNNIISKKYISWENYHLDTAVIPCIKTQRIWSNNSDFLLYDYYSKYGQMKRDYLYKNTQVKNQLGITVGYADLRETYNVTSFSISEP